MSRRLGLAAVAMALLTALAMLPPGVAGAVPGPVDEAGGTAAAQAENVTAALTTPNDTVELNETFELDASNSTGEIDHYLWDYTGDGAPNRNTTSAVIFTYLEDPDATGDLTITVTAVGESGATDEATTEITVVENDSDDGNESDPPGEDPPDDGNESDPGDGNESDPPDDGDGPDEGDGDEGGDSTPVVTNPTDDRTTVSVDRPGENVVAADVDAPTGDVTVPLPSAGNGTAVAFDNVTVHLVQDNEFSVRATASAANGTNDSAGPSLANVGTLATLTVEQESLEGWANGGTTVSFSVPGEQLAAENVTPDAVSVYRQNNGNWTALNTSVDGPTAANESAAENGSYEYSATSSRFGTFAVAIDRPDIEVVSFELSETELQVGETVKATAVVENYGRADGQFEEVLARDGTAVRNRSVDVSAQGNASLEFVLRPDSAGEYELALGNETASYSVEAAETSDEGTTSEETSETTSEDATTTAAATSTMAPESTTDDAATDDGTATVSGGQPGFGAAVALVALLAAALLAVRRRP